MKHTHDGDNGDWLDNLEAIMAGDAPLPDEENEELLHVATRLASALAPLREIAGTNISQNASALPHLQAKSRGMRLRALQAPLRARLLVAVLLLLVGMLGSISAIGTAPFWDGTSQALHASTSLDQINGVSIASLARPHAGLKPLPLLPTTGPFTLQASTYGVLTDASDANSMTAFVAGYRINGHDVLLYEQPSDVAFLSTTAQRVRIGTREGQLFEDDAGNHALQWYQNNMLCQLTSQLPIVMLLQIASGFQPIRSWDLLR
jgi:hypothetical protein